MEDFSWVPERDKAYIVAFEESADGDSSKFLRLLRFHAEARLLEIESEITAENQILRECLLLAINQLQNVRIDSIEKELFKIQNPKNSTWSDIAADIATTILFIAATTIITETVIASVSYAVAMRVVTRNNKLKGMSETALKELNAAKTALKGGKNDILLARARLRRGQNPRDVIQRTRADLRRTEASLKKITEQRRNLENNEYYKGIVGSNMPKDLQEIATKTREFGPDSPMVKLVIPKGEIARRELRNLTTTLTKDGVSGAVDLVSKSLKVKPNTEAPSGITPANHYLSELLRVETEDKYQIQIKKSLLWALDEEEIAETSIIPNILLEADARAREGGTGSTSALFYQDEIRSALVNSFELYFWLNLFDQKSYFDLQVTKFTSPNDSFTGYSSYFRLGTIANKNTDTLTSHQPSYRDAGSMTSLPGGSVIRVPAQNVFVVYRFIGVNQMTEAIAFYLLDKFSSIIVQCLQSNGVSQPEKMIEELKEIQKMPVNNSVLGISDAYVNRERDPAISALKTVIIYSFLWKLNSVNHSLSNLTEANLEKITSELLPNDDVPNETLEKVLASDIKIQKIEELIKDIEVGLGYLAEAVANSPTATFYEPLTTGIDQFLEQAEAPNSVELDTPADWYNRIQQDLSLAKAKLNELPPPSAELEAIYKKKTEELGKKLDALESKLTSYN